MNNSSIPHFNHGKEFTRLQSLNDYSYLPPPYIWTLNK